MSLSKNLEKIDFGANFHLILRYLDSNIISTASEHVENKTFYILKRRISKVRLPKIKSS